MIYRSDIFERPAQPSRLPFLSKKIEHTYAGLHFEGPSLLVAQAALKQPVPQRSKLHEIADQELQAKLYTDEGLHPVEARRLVEHCIGVFNSEGHQPSLDIATAIAHLRESKIRLLARAGLYGTPEAYAAAWMRFPGSSPNVTIYADYPEEGATRMPIGRFIDPAMPHTRFGFFFPTDVNNQ